jgi:aminoglycoside 3-N-acetyltransferase
MPFSRSSLIADLHALGLAPGDTVMVHASVRSVGPVYGGPDEIHQAIVEAVSPGGTMMMLLGCPDGYDDIGRPKTSAEEAAALRAHLPAFDKHATRANRDNGALCEFFRTWPGSMVSDSVSVRVGARGARAGWLVSEQTQRYPFGRGTPFEKLVQANGKLLLLGSDHDQVTLMHYAETIADFLDKIVVKYEVPLTIDGKRVWVPGEEFNSSDPGAHANWPGRFFALIVDGFIARHDGTAQCTHGKVGNSDSYLLDAAALVAHAVPIMEQTARGDPYFKDHPPARETL